MPIDEARKEQQQGTALFTLPCFKTHHQSQIMNNLVRRAIKQPFPQNQRIGLTGWDGIGSSGRNSLFINCQNLLDQIRLLGGVMDKGAQAPSLNQLDPSPLTLNQKQFKHHWSISRSRAIPWCLRSSRCTQIKGRRGRVSCFAGYARICFCWDPVQWEQRFPCELWCLLQPWVMLFAAYDLAVLASPVSVSALAVLALLAVLAFTLAPAC